jgi:hypothetical protein
MTTFWIAIGAMATVGIFILTLRSMGKGNDNGNPVPPPRANITCENHSVAGLQIRSNLSGNWNQSAVADNGDIVFDMEYAGKVTTVGVYTKDRKILLGDITFDFKHGKSFCRVHLRPEM